MNKTKEKRRRAENALTTLSDYNNMSKDIPNRFMRDLFVNLSNTENGALVDSLEVFEEVIDRISDKYRAILNDIDLVCKHTVTEEIYLGHTHNDDIYETRCIECGKLID